MWEPHTYLVTTTASPCSLDACLKMLFLLCGNGNLNACDLKCIQPMGFVMSEELHEWTVGHNKVYWCMHYNISVDWLDFFSSGPAEPQRRLSWRRAMEATREPPAPSGRGWRASVTSTQKPTSRRRMCLECARSSSPSNSRHSFARALTSSVWQRLLDFLVLFLFATRKCISYITFEKFSWYL